MATSFKLRALNILCLCPNMDIIRHTCNVSEGKQSVLLTLSVNHNFANFVTVFVWFSFRLRFGLLFMSP